MALSYFTIRKSIFGRMLALSSTGGIVSGVSSTGKQNSTDVSMAAQMWGPAMVQTIGAGATLTKILNCGVTYFTTGSSAAAGYSIDAPVKGVYKWMVFDGLGSTLITVETTDASILFHISSAHRGSTIGSTALTYSSSDGARGTAALIGLSTTIYQLMSRNSSNYIST